jgi:hypothetical protein
VKPETARACHVQGATRLGNTCQPPDAITVRPVEKQHRNKLTLSPAHYKKQNAGKCREEMSTSVPDISRT